MKLRFDPNQPYQLDAVSAVTGVFEGQELRSGEFSLHTAGEMFSDCCNRQKNAKYNRKGNSLMTKLWWVLIVITCFFIFCLGCYNPINHDYSIKQKGDMKDLLIFYYTMDMFGVDTIDYTVKSQIHINDMVIGGITKLPNGGIAFTHHRTIGNNSWGHSLYVTDKDCNLLNTYNICYSPMAPKIVNNLLLIGSSAIEQPHISFRFQIYDANNYGLKKEYLFRDMVDAWQITHWNDKAYMGINVFETTEKRDYSYIVELDLNTLDTTIIGDTTEFFLDATLLAERYGSLLYIFSIRGKDICIYDLDSKSVQTIVKVSEYPEILALQANNVVLPRVYNGYLYGYFARQGNVNGELGYLVKFDMNTLKYVSHTELTVIKGVTTGEHLLYIGHFLVRQFLRDSETQIVFEDMETGNIEHEVTFKK